MIIPTSRTASLALLLQTLPVCWSTPITPLTSLLPRQASEPSEYTANDSIGPGGSAFVDSPHFRVYSDSDEDAQNALGKLEAAFECFVRDLNFRSTGVSFNGDSDGAWTKTNVY